MPAPFSDHDRDSGEAREAARATSALRGRARRTATGLPLYRLPPVPERTRRCERARPHASVTSPFPREQEAPHYSGARDRVDPDGRARHDPEPQGAEECAVPASVRAFEEGPAPGRLRSAEARTDDHRSLSNPNHEREQLRPAECHDPSQQRRTRDPPKPEAVPRRSVDRDGRSAVRIELDHTSGEPQSEPRRLAVQPRTVDERCAALDGGVEGEGLSRSGGGVGARWPGEQRRHGRKDTNYGEGTPPVHPGTSFG